MTEICRWHITAALYLYPLSSPSIPFFHPSFQSCFICPLISPFVHFTFSSVSQPLVSASFPTFPFCLDPPNLLLTPLLFLPPFSSVLLQADLVEVLFSLETNHRGMQASSAETVDKGVLELLDNSLWNPKVFSLNQPTIPMCLRSKASKWQRTIRDQGQ